MRILHVLPYKYRKFHREELDAFRRQDFLLFTSEQDRNLAHGEVPENRNTVIPNGADCHYFKPSDIEPEPYSAEW